MGQPASEHHTSGLTTRLILTYVEQQAGRPAVRAVLESCGLLDREDDLRDPTRWFAFETKVALLEAAADVLDQPDVAWRIGQAVVELDVLGPLKLALRAFGSPRLVYSALPGTAGRFTNAHRLELLESGAASARFRYTDVSGVGYREADCQYTAGLLSCVPTMFGDVPAEVRHPSCALRGAAECVYELSWTRPGARRSWVVAATGATMAAALASRSSVVRRVLPLPAGVAVESTRRAIAAGRRRRRALEAELRDQKEAAERLSVSLRDLVYDLRTDEVLRKIMSNAQAALIGREVAVVVATDAGMRAYGSPGVPAPSLEALERWAEAHPDLVERPCASADLSVVRGLDELAAHPETPLGALTAAPLVFRGTPLGALVALAHGGDAFLPKEIALLADYAAEASIALANARLVERLEALARSDSLTGLLNHGEFQKVLARRLEAAQRAGGTVSVVLLDLDRLATINEEYGHAEGDRVLRIAADAVRSVCGPRDLAGRIGGDEFALVLDGRDAEEARELAALIDRELASRAAARFSWGIAEWPDDGPSQSLLLFNADRALYAAKGHRSARAGRGAGHEEGSPEDAPSSLTPLHHRRSLTAALARAVDAKDSYTRSHCETVAELSAAIGQEIGLDPHRVLKLRMAGLLHDVGKIGIADRILQKPTALTAEESEIMKMHSTLGHSILYAAELFDEALWILHHHEQIDGGGYPQGLDGEDIPLESRIILVADAFEAMTSDRPYRSGRPDDEALAELERHAGTQFDARCVEAIRQVVRNDSRWLTTSASVALRGLEDDDRTPPEEG